MDGPIFIVNSVTYAMRAEKVLQKFGITSKILRSSKYQTSSGCGYAVKVNCPEETAADIFNRAGIKVVSVVEED